MAAAAATIGVASTVNAATLCDQMPNDPILRTNTTNQAAEALEESTKPTPSSRPSNYIQATSTDEILKVATSTDLPIEEKRFNEAAQKARKHAGGLKLFSGNGNMALSLEIAKNLGLKLGRATVGRFADGECNVRILENVRGKDVYVVQPTCPPVNDNIMELLLMVSTLNRASARRITVVIPYYGYARQDRKMQVRDSNRMCYHYILISSLLSSYTHLSHIGQLCPF